VLDSESDLTWDDGARYHVMAERELILAAELAPLGVKIISQNLSIFFKIDEFTLPVS
jgi:hypothetical protein